MHRYKVGDKVRLKDKEAFLRQYPSLRKADGSVDCGWTTMKAGISMTSLKVKALGTTVTIRVVNDSVNGSGITGYRVESEDVSFKLYGSTFFDDCFVDYKEFTYRGKKYA